MLRRSVPRPLRLLSLLTGLLTLVLIGLQVGGRGATTRLPTAAVERRAVRARARSDGPRDAYVTLLYGGFLLGARVLGQSLRETDTTRDLIALCTQEVSEHTRQVLRDDGWIIRHITNIHSPYEGKSSRGDYFSGIFSKLHIWNMTEYERIIYLDSDALVLSNIDHMFDCGTFCAAFRHSDLFNAGIVVVEPSRVIFRDMLTKIQDTPSYDDGDQGFLNVYFKDLRYASMFNWSNKSRQRQPMRMPAGLNADIGSYYANSRWNMPREEIRIIHYTLGPVKPWIWWTNFLCDLNPIWTSVRKRLPQYSYHSDTFEHPSSPLFWLPYLILAGIFTCVKCFECYFYQYTSNRHIASALRLFGSLNAKLSHFFPLSFLFISYSLAFKIVPTTMMPSQAEYVFWLWSNCFLVILFGFYCYLCHITGKLRDNHHHSFPRKKLQTLSLYIIFAISYILVKLVPPHMEPLSRRIMSFFVLVMVHLAVSHVTGQFLIQLWTGYKVHYGVASDPEGSGSSVHLSPKKVCH